MMPNTIEDNNIINLVLNQWGNFCNICGTKRTADNIKIVKRTTETIVLHINCNQCKNGHFISFSNNSTAFTMQQFSSDLSEEEFSKFSNSPVSIDDLIDTHIALKKIKNRTDLMKLISSSN